jgi:hypothetical protein
MSKINLTNEQGAAVATAVNKLCTASAGYDASGQAQFITMGEEAMQELKEMGIDLMADMRNANSELEAAIASALTATVH